MLCKVKRFKSKPRVKVQEKEPKTKSSAEIAPLLGAGSCSFSTLLLRGPWGLGFLLDQPQEGPSHPTLTSNPIGEPGREAEEEASWGSLVCPSGHPPPSGPSPPLEWVKSLGKRRGVR